MKRISRNLTAAALTGALALAGVTAAHAEEASSQYTSSSEQGGDNGSSDGDKSSFDDFKDKLSSEDGKPTDLGIAAIVLGVLGALAAISPAAAQTLGINLPF